MHSKHALIFLCCIIGLLLLNSCLGDGDSETVYLTDDAQLYAFSLSSDSVSELASVVFSIDQINGKIFNRDSMTFGTEFSKDKAILAYSMASTYAVFEVVGDTIYASKDSIDISAKKLQFKTTSASGSKTKLYDFVINVHTVDPDSVIYSRMQSSLPLLDADETKAIVFGGKPYIFTKNAGTVSLYEGETMDDWIPVPILSFPESIKLKDICVGNNMLFALDGAGVLYATTDLTYWFAADLYNNIQAVLGYQYGSNTQEEGLALIIEDNGVKRFAFTNFVNWTLGSEVQNGFPVEGFESQSYSTMNTQRVVVFGGTDKAGTLLNSVWATEDGLYWVRINSDESSFPVLENFNALIYNEEMYIFNGKYTSGLLNKTVYYSPDGGNTWNAELSKIQLPSEFEGRYNASVIKDNSEIFFYIIGGKNSGNMADVWRGHKNKYTFVE